jgi:hypothetical protein
VISTEELGEDTGIGVVGLAGEDGVAQPLVILIHDVIE